MSERWVREWVRVCEGVSERDRHHKRVKRWCHRTKNKPIGSHHTTHNMDSPGGMSMKKKVHRQGTNKKKHTYLRQTGKEERWERMKGKKKRSKLDSNQRGEWVGSTWTLD